MTNLRISQCDGHHLPISLWTTFLNLRKEKLNDPQGISDHTCSFGIGFPSCLPRMVNKSRFIAHLCSINRDSGIEIEYVVSVTVDGKISAVRVKTTENEMQEMRTYSRLSTVSSRMSSPIYSVSSHLSTTGRRAPENDIVPMINSSSATGSVTYMPNPHEQVFTSQLCRVQNQEKTNKYINETVRAFFRPCCRALFLQIFLSQSMRNT